MPILRPRDVMARPPFAAVLLAGGRSRRMGRDKALLPLPDGRRLWERQIEILRALEPAELYVSGSAREGFNPDANFLADETPGLGPLAGIAAVLKAMRSPLAVVLAVDLPMMTADFLQSLVEVAGPRTGRGCVPLSADGFFEPLAAVYPREALFIAEERLRDRELSLQPFVRALIGDGLVDARPIRDEEVGLFANWNTPADLSPL